VVTFNQQYAGSTWANLRDGLVVDRLVPTLVYPMLPLIARPRSSVSSAVT
jgi:hypothetical protein